MTCISSMRPCFFYVPMDGFVITIDDPKNLRGRKVKIEKLLALKDKTISVIARQVLQKALSRLNELSIPFSIGKVKEEVDVEDADWKYATIEITVDASDKELEPIREEVIRSAYHGIVPEDSTKVLLHVRSS